MHAGTYAYCIIACNVIIIIISTPSSWFGTWLVQIVDSGLDTYTNLWIGFWTGKAPYMALLATFWHCVVSSSEL